MNESADLYVISDAGAVSPVMSGELVVPRGPNTPTLRVDFAHVFRDHLVVYGWILGLFKWVTRAEIAFADVVVDLMSFAIPIPRPDVAKHFGVGLDDDNHGFCLWAALPDSGARSGYLRLSVVLHSGEALDRVWPVGAGDSGVINFFQKNQTTLLWLLQHLPTSEAGRLRDLCAPAIADLPVIDAPNASYELRLHLSVDLCVVLDYQCVVVSGWLYDWDRNRISATVSVGSVTVEFLKNIEFVDRPDTRATSQVTQRHHVPPPAGFTWVMRLTDPIAEPGEAVFDMFAGRSQMRLRCAIDAQAENARTALRGLFNDLDSNAAVGLIERIAEVVKDLPASQSTYAWLASEHALSVERLPLALPKNTPRCLLHIDSLTPVADDGVFIDGWCVGEFGAIHQVFCHSGLTSMRLDDRWLRRTRVDVTAHLRSEGIAAADNEHGVVCYVPLKRQVGDYFFSVISELAMVRRMRLPKTMAPAPALETVRSLLNQLSGTHRSLRSLLDEHVGPAVQMAWKRRYQSRQPITMDRFGVYPANPRVSVIVPLYGRYDFAEYQMALFADDPDFQSLELIYFVDDPAIYDEFRSQCQDLYEIYRVPFTVAFAGANLGFSGANNRAASIAWGRHLLLMNSDVMPKRPGWVGELLAIYCGLEKPGLLGAKLLYEDGSLQHAGMTYRRHPGWNDLWIIDHPQKGQSPLDLHGIRKADAVTAACVLIDAALYRELGGLCENYIIGDFEDSDLCLRAEAAGRRNWVALDVELYHLERQSQNRIGDAQCRKNLTLYNCWQHDQRWASFIERRKR